MKNEHKHVLARLLLGALLILGMSFWMNKFVVHATTWSLPGGSGWNNLTGFLNTTFWNNSPISGDIIKALYGSGAEGSLYTTNWTGYTSGSCINSGMNVIYLTGGLGKISGNLSGNTIYVLDSGNYLTSGHINFSGNCISLIGSGNVIIYSTGFISTGMVYISGHKYIILDNISINGASDGSGAIHALNTNGIDIESSHSISINTVKTYNSSGGIRYNNISFSLLNNIISFNTTLFGISFVGSYQIAVNNTSVFNTTTGVIIQTSTGIVLNNVSSLNNTNYGIAIISSQNNIFQSIDVLNNGLYGIYLSNATGNIFYGTLRSFANISGTFLGTTGNDQYLTGGTGTYYSSFGRASGTIDTTTGFLWNYVSNPIDINDNSLLDRTSHTITGGRQVWTGESTVRYSFGESSKYQVQPVLYSGTSLISGGSYTTSGTLGSTTLLTYNSITTSPSTYSSTSGITVSILWSNIANYRIFGDIISQKTGALTSGTEVITGRFLSGSDGTKFIFGQFTVSGSTRMTHYGTSILLDTIFPIFTGTTASGTNVTSGTHYNTTGITLVFSDTNLSGATLSGLNSGNTYLNTGFSSGTTITTGGTYLLTIYDLASNSTGMIFTIDILSPTLTGVNSGTYYNTGKTITGTDDITFSGFLLSGTFYTGASITVTGNGVRILTGYDAAGNTTGVTFTIDTINPAFTGTTASGTNVKSGTYYNTTGITLVFSDTNLSGATLSGLNSGNTYLNTGFSSGTTITTGGTYLLTIYDLASNSTGMIFTIDTINPVITGAYPTSGLNISGGNTITFTRSGYDTNISGYTLYVGTTGYAATGSSYPIVLANGTYTWYVIITDRAGNTGVSTTLPFTLTTPLTGTVTVTGSNIQYISSSTYTKSYVGLYLFPNQPCDYTVTGDIIATITGSTMGALYLYPYLTGSDGLKNVYVTFTNTSGDTVQLTTSIYLDTVAGIPTLTSPSSGATVTGAFSFTWSASTDVVGISGYRYYVSTGATFATIAKSGFVTTTTVALANMEVGSTGTLYWYVKAVDKLGNSGSATGQPFNYDQLVDIVPNTFSFTAATKANLDQVYASNTITITGLSANTQVLASINRGALFISGVMVGTTGYVQNGWTVKIELSSSDEYDTKVTSTLNIGGITAVFAVTTKQDTSTDYSDIDTNLSNTAKLQIIAIFEVLRDLYAGDKKDELFNSLMIMLQVEINALGTSSTTLDQREALQYLYDLADQYRNQGGVGTGTFNTSWIVNGTYTAPNGKKYIITYDSVKKQFTSTNFVTPKYFPTLDVLKYTIDINNPAGTAYLNAKPILARWGRIAIDGTRQTSAYTAPNHKVFYFFKTMGGRYSSYTFTIEKYFDSLDEVKENVYNNNR